MPSINDDALPSTDELEEWMAAGSLSMSSVPTFEATIYVGTLDRLEGTHLSPKHIESLCRQFVAREGLCVTVTPTTFVYGSDGASSTEDGVAVGLIHYPRFPREDPGTEITKTALGLATWLLVRMRQERVSVVTPARTIMLTNEDRVQLNPDHETTSG